MSADLWGKGRARRRSAGGRDGDQGAVAHSAPSALVVEAPVRCAARRPSGRGPDRSGAGEPDHRQWMTAWTWYVEIMGCSATVWGGSKGRGTAGLREAELCIQTQAALEAIRLTQLGARAGLVAQLTGLEKAVANRLYRQLHGRPSPPGQLPFTDSWYLKQDRRMLQATLVWHLSQRFALIGCVAGAAADRCLRDAIAGW